ncbi:MAG: hypothetical protein JWN72_1673 [Thermoleophilia bacterium]|nr:hypothetical protein [Thermoleophilia bacterium]
MIVSTTPAPAMRLTAPPMMEFAYGAQHQVVSWSGGPKIAAVAYGAADHDRRLMSIDGTPTSVHASWSDAIAAAVGEFRAGDQPRASAVVHTSAGWELHHAVQAVEYLKNRGPNPYEDFGIRQFDRITSIQPWLGVSSPFSALDAIVVGTQVLGVAHPDGA